MPSFEDLIKQGGQPIGAAPAPSGSSYEQLMAQGGQAQEPGQGQPEPEKEQIGGLEAVGQGLYQGVTLGFGDEIVGAVGSLFGPHTYQEIRDAQRQRLADTSEQHPWLYGGGELAGGVASSFIPGLGVAKGATALKAGLGAAKAGLVQGLGSSEADLTKGDLMGSIRDTVKGGLTAGITGTALHGLGSKLAGKAEANFEGDIVKDAMSRSRGKDYLQTQRIIESDAPATKAILHSEDFKPVQKALRSGNTEKARDEIGLYIDKVGANREPDWKALDKTLGDKAGVSAGSVIDRFENEVQKGSYQHGQSDVVKVLSGVKDRLQQTWSTANKDAAATYLERSGAGDAAVAVRALEGPTVTGNDVWKAAEAATAKDGVVPEQVRTAIKGIDFKYDPNAKIPGLELRTALTKAQDDAVSALGTIAETEHARLKAAPEKVYNQAMDVFLKGAESHSPEAKEIAQRILDRNKKLSLALAFQEGLEQKAKKELVGSQGLTSGLQGTAGTILKGMGVGSLLSGNFGTAAAEIAAPYALKAASTGARRANDTLARVMYAAEQGNPWAQKQIALLRATPQGLAKLAAARNVAPRKDETGPTPQTLEQL